MAQVKLIAMPDPDRKINAIKDIRTVTRWGLKESKAVVDTMYSEDLYLDLNDEEYAYLISQGWALGREDGEEPDPVLISYLTELHELRGKLVTKDNRIQSLEDDLMSTRFKLGSRPDEESYQNLLDSLNQLRNDYDSLMDSLEDLARDKLAIERICEEVVMHPIPTVGVLYREIGRIHEIAK